MIDSAKPRTMLAALALACLSTSVFATPLVFHPDRSLYLLRLFPHDGDVVATWQNGISHIDAESLEITDIDEAQFSLVPIPVPGSEEFFYARLGNYPEQLKSLSGRQSALLSTAVDPGAFAGAGGYLFFTTYGSGLDIWASDGTQQGTSLLLDFDHEWVPPCNILCPPGYNFPRQIHATPGGRLYFGFMDGTETGGHRYEVWTRDPAAEFPGLPPVPVPATRRLATFADEPYLSLTLANGRLFFVVDEPVGHSLWTSDGSAAGTLQVKTFSGLGGNFENPPLHDAVDLAGLLYFIVEVGARRELWRSDGTAAGTTLVHDFGFGPRVAAVWADGRQLYLAVDAAGAGEELWISGGVPGSTRLLADIGPGLAGGKPRSFAPLPDGRFLISLDDGVHGQEPWISDGTTAGTTLLADARPGIAGTNPSDFVRAGGRLFFAGDADGGLRVPSYVEVALPGEPPTCAADQLCLQDGRFRVETFWTAAGENGKGKRAVASDQAGLFSFFSPDNWEVMVKVLDGCAINDRFWVFASAATDVQYEIRVTDLETGTVKSYAFGGGSPAPATTDIDAFATCGADLGEATP